MFHVKHSPVEEAPPLGRTSLENLKSIRIDELKGQALRQLGKALSLPAPDAQGLGAP